ncbi:hypothetical protein C8J56DRAFT_905778 [Mycena floridula]|nr:hypothetical protein C8J56DRAFT_905778 [Mycena floridula]
MARTKASAMAQSRAAMAQSRALGVSCAPSMGHSHSSVPPDLQPVRSKKPTTTKSIATAKKSTTTKKFTANVRAALPEEPEGKMSKYERYYDNNCLQRQKDANSWYERVGRERRRKAVAAKKAEKEAAKATTFNTEQSAAVKESLAYTTIHKVKQDMMVWKIQDGGFEVWGEWEENDERRLELKSEGERIWFCTISLFQHYEPPQNVDEAVQIYNISVEVMLMLRIGLQAL